MVLKLEVVAESSRTGGHVLPTYEDDPRFNSSWWASGSAKSPVIYCRLLSGQEEVIRAKLLPESRTGLAYPTYSIPPGGAMEIHLIETRPDLRGHGLGKEGVDLIATTYLGPVIAMSLDASSDGFWRRMGWVEHVHPDGPNLGMSLFERS